MIDSSLTHFINYEIGNFSRDFGFFFVNLAINLVYFSCL